MKKRLIANSLLHWYEQNKRTLPWRDQHDPYIVWLSEIILQQTRVEQGMPYFMVFSQKFPTVHDLASADIEVVLRAWQGLGYYSRARNMHKCAQIIVYELDGVFPSQKNELEKLPGIGSYTAAAIASLAFGRREAVVDGNVMRVISRLYGILDDISANKTVKTIQQIADATIPAHRPDLFNQAIMEFGALHCTPKKPQCQTCVLAEVCMARQTQNVSNIPYKKAKIKKKDRFFAYFIINIHGRYLMRKRVAKDIWFGLFEFFLIESSINLPFDELILPEVLTKHPDRFVIGAVSDPFKHQLTHQTIYCTFHEIEMSDNVTFEAGDWPGYALYSPDQIHKLPKSILIDRYWGKKIN
ncbi:MAG: A/G-specific adenine glycosylase [Cyclobacteriaceae bacterium]|nr:A/G-specific adenine glycosylase [Cyclobacteriaceae bacterium]